MRSRRILAAATLLIAFAAPLALAQSTHPPVATFSIVAHDPGTGEMGVAVQSKYFSVGHVVPWGEAGVGVVATQANVNAGYGLQGLDLLRQGLSAEEVKDRLLAEDTFPGVEGRQFAVVDANGGIAVHTGPTANFWAGHRVGEHYSAQGNILTGPEVVEAMGDAFEAAEGPSPKRCRRRWSPGRRPEETAAAASRRRCWWSARGWAGTSTTTSWPGSRSRTIRCPSRNWGGC